jgi:CheY-like chemotaxis protein
MPIPADSTVLVVEDDDFCRWMAVTMLRRLGHEHIRTAGNGEEAVTACSEANFDFVLMDCDMPVMNGFDATRAIRALGISSPIVAHTACGSAGTAARCIEAGMDDFLVKPAQLAQLAMKLYRWLAVSRCEASRTA